MQHIALAVNDIQSCIEALTSAGGEAETGVLAEVGIKQTFLRRDEDTGVRIELIERDGGNFSDSSVESLYKSMERMGIC